MAMAARRAAAEQAWKEAEEQAREGAQREDVVTAEAAEAPSEVGGCSGATHGGELGRGRGKEGGARAAEARA